MIQHLDLIHNIAVENAKNIKVIDDKNDIEKDKPFFHVSKDDNGRWDCKGYNYETHDNADRMKLYMDYFKNDIFPNILPNTEITGYYNFEIHDGYYYLENGKDYNNCFVFSKNNSMQYQPCLLPDPFFIQNWGGANTSISDKTDWNMKENKIIFRGTTTGNKDPHQNERINICLWSLRNPNIYDFKISKIAQIDKQKILDCIPNFNEICSEPLTIENQIKYKYQLNVDGNVSRFLSWVYNYNVVNLKWKSKEELFYYPLIKDGDIHKTVDKNSIENQYNYFNNNQKEAQEIIKRAKNFSKDFFRPFTHKYYTTCLFEEIAK